MALRAKLGKGQGEVRQHAAETQAHLSEKTVVFDTCDHSFNDAVPGSNSHAAPC